MKQTLYVPFPYDIQVLNFYLHSYFADVRVAYCKNNGEKFSIKFKVEEVDLLYFEKAQMLQLEWLTSQKNDLVADSLSLLILQINEKPTPQLLTLMETVANDRAYDEFVKKLLIIM